MAKKNVRDEPPQNRRPPRAKQMSDIILILDKMELLLQAVSKLDKDGRHETVLERTGNLQFLPQNRPLRQHVREFPEELLEPAQGPDFPFRHPLRQGEALDDPKVRQAIRTRRRKRQTRWKNSSSSTRLSPRQKPKSSTIKIKRRNGKENETQQQAAKAAEARSNSPSTAQRVHDQLGTAEELRALP